MAKTTTITTGSGKTVTGQEVRREDPNVPRSLTELAVRAVLAVGTGGVSEILRMQPDKVTVRDAKGNFWTGKDKK